MLFSDASRIDLRRLRRDVGLPLRLLAVGLPLTLALGALTALLVFEDLPWSLALFVGAALAPTDAALSSQVIGDRRVPRPLRLGLNVESGLNDGIVTPVVALAIALAASDLGLATTASRPTAWQAMADVGLGVGLGIAVGGLGAAGVNVARARGWALPGGAQLATLAVAVGAFTVSVAIESNGFIAAFVAGLVFGHVVERAPAASGGAREDRGDDGDVGVLADLGGELLALVVWFLFGAGLVPIALAHGSASTVAYAVLSLTALRMLPVAIALVGSGVPGPHRFFLGWFGPRGLASVVFALLAVEQLGETDLVESAVAVVATTVLLSVVLHGVTASPAAQRFGSPPSDGRDDDLSPARTRHLLRRGRAGAG